MFLICILQNIGQDVMLSQLSNCTVIIKSNPITLHATHLSNCILMCGPVQTSIYLDNCNNCTLSLACQQLRAHNSRETNIYLHVTSKGIIEDCNDIKVKPYFSNTLFMSHEWIKIFFWNFLGCSIQSEIRWAERAVSKNWSWCQHQQLEPTRWF